MNIRCFPPYTWEIFSNTWIERPEAGRIPQSFTDISVLAVSPLILGGIIFM